MPIVLDTPDAPVHQSGALTVGLLNNLGDGGMAAGERQWIDLLEAAAGPRLVVMRLFSLASIARGQQAHSRMSGRYRDGAALAADRLDGLIVTGAEPSTIDLRAEPFWTEMAAIIDWAGRDTRSTIWSCLAAHAVALHLDGVERRRLPAKCTGNFDVGRVGNHPFLAGAPRRMENSHSRWNDLDEDELVAAGYEILTRGAIGVDACLREGSSLFVLLQGHPEYDDDALGRELRRDLVRWSASRAGFPSIPANYFADEADAKLKSHLAAGDAAAAMKWDGRARARSRALPLALGRAWLDRLADNAGSRTSSRPGTARYRTTTLVPTATRP